MKLHLPAFAAAVSLFAPSAFAAESIGVLALSEPPGPSADLVEITAQLRAVLAERTAGVLAASQLRERMTGQTSTASLAELDRAFAGALATYQAGDFEGAIRTLRAVVDDLERLPDGTEAFEQWSRAMLRLARAEQTVGRRDEAQALVERLVRTNPGVKVDATQYPPSFVKGVDDARAALKSMKMRKLVVNAQKGVRVFVDGRDVGAAPLTVELPPGKYRVSGAHAGQRVPGVSADLSSEDQTVELDVRFAEALRPNAGPGLALAGADRARRVVTAAAWLGLDRVVIASFAQEADVTFLVGTFYDVRRGAIHREGRLRLAGKAPPSGGLTALATFLVTGQPSSLVAVGPGGLQPVATAFVPPAGAAGSKSSIPITTRDPAAQPRSKALGWSAVGAAGAAVLLGGFAVYESIQSGKRYDEARAMLGPDGRLRAPYTTADYNGRISDGDSAKNLALGTGVGAGVALAGSAVLGYLSYRQTGEIGPFRF
jgi:hypothetical protein